MNLKMDIIFYYIFAHFIDHTVCFLISRLNLIARLLLDASLFDVLKDIEKLENEESMNKLAYISAVIELSYQ